MTPVLMDSLSLKIRSFLKSAGVAIDESVSSSTQLIRFFEKQYGLQMMGFLEQEWVEEQVERDVARGQFQQLRDYVQHDQLADFDSAVASIWD